jgi:hypothetical protein
MTNAWWAGVVLGWTLDAAQQGRNRQGHQEAEDHNRAPEELASTIAVAEG